MYYAQFSPFRSVAFPRYENTTRGRGYNGLPRSRNREIYIAPSLKTKFKRHLPGEFHDCSWVFWSRHCSRKGARRAEERKKMTKLDFHHFQVRHFSNNFEQSPCYCKMGQRRQRADLSVFGRTKVITRRNISV